MRPREVAVALLALAGCGGQDGPAPGLVLVVVDTLRADLGGPLAGAVSAPELDRLARDGVAFTEAFTHAPITLPAHVALFSSRPCHEVGVLTNGQQVPDDLPLLAEHLRAQGFMTHAVTSMGSVNTGEPGRGLARGFDSWVRAGSGFIDSGDAVRARLGDVLDAVDTDGPFFLFAHFSDPHEPYNDHASSEMAEIRVDGEPVDAVTTSRMTTWSRELALEAGEHTLEISGARDVRLRTFQLTSAGEVLAPEFIAGGLKVPAPVITARFAVPEGARKCRVHMWLTDHPRKGEVPQRYASEVEFVDRQVGALLDALRARGLYDRSLVIVTSDHGESIGERRFIGHVRSLHDELLHVPLIIKPPDGSPHVAHLRERARELVALVDVAPTALDLLDLPDLPGQLGFSLLDESRRSFVVAETVLPDSLKEDRIEIDLLAIRDVAWKLVYVVDEDRFELYDLGRDPSEQDDVYPGLPGDRAEWPAMLRALTEASAARSAETSMDAETVETLRALGYLGE